MKKKRQENIIELIMNQEEETQEELAERLREAGHIVTQATVSRDSRELHLSKAQGSGGRQKYVRGFRPEQGDELKDTYVRVLKDGTLSVDTAGNILVVKTVGGMAMAVAAALDALRFPELVGCIAGDDTIMCAVRSPGEALALRSKLQEML